MNDEPAKKQIPYDPPLKITIPLPTEIPRARGIHATTSYGGNLRIRCENSEYELVKKEAEAIGLNVASFGRFVIRSVASALKEHRESGASTISIESPNLAAVFSPPTR